MEIKFRRKDLVKAMHRLDPKCQEIAQALASAGNRHDHFINIAFSPCVRNTFKSVQIAEWNTSFFPLIWRYHLSIVNKIGTLTYDVVILDLPVKERKTLERQQKEREEQLLPIYQQVMLVEKYVCTDSG